MVYAVRPRTCIIAVAIFFKTKVFVGNLSPENLSKALNQTQIAAAEYYRWFHKKVDAYAKIQ